MKDFIRVMKALSDPNRVKVIKMLQHKEMCVCEIQFALGLAQPTVSKHLKVLERAGLIARGREAQWRPCRLRAEPMKDVAEWVEHYRLFWEGSFDRLDEYLQELQKQEKPGGRRK